MPRIRVMLADDHRMFGEGLARLLEPQFEIVGIIENGRDLIAAAERLRPDVIVVDISMPSLNGIEAARRIQEIPHPPKIVFLTMHEDATFVAAAFQSGASGYVLKRSATRGNHNGRSGGDVGDGTYVSPLVDRDVAEMLMKRMSTRKRSSRN